MDLKKNHLRPRKNAEAEGGCMIKTLECEAKKNKNRWKNIKYPIFLCVMAIFQLEMGQNQQLPLKYQKKSTSPATALVPC